jgi:site-specific recombinase XerC
VLSDLDPAALLKTCSGKEFLDRLEEAMIRLRLDCGVRVSELCGITVAGLDLDLGVAMVLGKGDKVRPETGSRPAALRPGSKIFTRTGSATPSPTNS